MKLYQFLFFFIVNSLCCIFANAQIVYTDVNSVSITSGYYNLDLNNDGTTDFTFRIYDATERCFNHWPPMGSKGSQISTSTSNQIVDTVFPYPNQLNLNTTIGNGTRFWSNAAFQTLSIRSRPSCVVPNIHSGYWNASEGYLGLKLIVGADTLFGWIRLKVSTEMITIRDYAYNSIPGQPILAGDTGTGLTGINDMQAALNYNLSPNPSTGHITISLTEQSPVTEVIITNAFGQEVSRSRYSNTSKLEMEIKGKSGLYFVRVVAGDRTGVYSVVKM